MDSTLAQYIFHTWYRLNQSRELVGAEEKYQAKQGRFQDNDERSEKQK